MAKFQPRAQTEGSDDGLKEKMIAVDRDHLFLQAVVAAFGLGTRLKLRHVISLACLRCQNCRPASRAASASALTRPWYAKPARSNATCWMPAALARSAMRLPTTAAAAALPPLPGAPSCVRRSFSTVEAVARMRAPSLDTMWA